MEWKKLLTQTRLVEEKDAPKEFEYYYISPFERDYERIVSSAVFRRLQDKTQVFPLAKSDFVRTRLTHSIEVSTIAKQLGIMCFQNSSSYQHLPIDTDEGKDENLKMKRAGDIEAILSCAGLLHDLGNPPFGHVGEKMIREWFKNNLKNIYSMKDGKEYKLNEKMIMDLTHFEGNAQALRILLKARHRSEINLPFSIISALIKYPTRSDEINEFILIRDKIGCYQAEEKSFIEIAKEVGTINAKGEVIRHPLAYLVEAADDIAYMTADLEDAVKSGIVSVDELLSFFKIKLKELSTGYDNFQHILRAEEAIKELNLLNESEEDKMNVMSQWGTYLRKWLMYVVCWRFSISYEVILKGEYGKDLFHDTNHSLTVKLLRAAMHEFVFDSRIIVEPEISAQIIIDFLLDKFIPAVVRFDGNGSMTIQDKKVITLISPNYIDDYFKAIETDQLTDEAELLYRRILIATDFISGMTDGYAKMLYKKMSGLE